MLKKKQKEFNTSVSINIGFILYKTKEKIILRGTGYMTSSKTFYVQKDDCIEIIDCTDFDITHILECGQIFRYEKTIYGYLIHASNQEIQVYCQKGGFKIFAQNLEFAKKYFDLDNNYANIKADLLRSNLTNKAIEYGHGIRILNQDPLEMLISFIISANNNIPRIKKIIEALCSEVGTDMGTYRAFPTLQQLAVLTVDDYVRLGAGYRAKYLYDTVKMLNNGFDLDELYNLDTVSARQKLLELKGVGRKVADCILLFAYHKTDVFPTDTWIVQLYQDIYGVKKPATFVSDYFAKLFAVNSGYAQQYLYYEKMNNRGEKNE